MADRCSLLLSTTYGDVLPGLLLIGLGAGLLLPTATNSVVGSVPQGDSGMGSATNAVALQVGGALGVAVIGSVASTRYQDHITAALGGRHLPTAVSDAILGSLGGALHVAHAVGGTTGALLAGAARAAFMSGLAVSFSVGAIVALGGILIVLAYLPQSVAEGPPDPDASDSDDAAVAHSASDSCGSVGVSQAVRRQGHTGGVPATYGSARQSKSPVGRSAP